jgi:hypothetical protein
MKIFLTVRLGGAINKDKIYRYLNNAGCGPQSVTQLFGNLLLFIAGFWVQVPTGAFMGCFFETEEARYIFLHKSPCPKGAQRRMKMLSGNNM